MRIALRLYSILWLSILILYSFNWTRFSYDLDPSLLIFLIFTIFFSFILSVLLKKKKYCTTSRVLFKPTPITVVLVVCFIINFIYAKQIPLFSISAQESIYRDFEGIPTFYPLIFTFSAFYYFYLIYHGFSLKKKLYFFDAMLLLVMFLFAFSRLAVLFSLIGTILCWYLLKKSKRHTNVFWYIRSIIIIILLLYVLLFLFGCLGNIRSGYAWNDCSHIEELGQYVYYPSFLPKQFMWAYSYLTSPLANLNYNVIHSNCNDSVPRFFACFITEIVSKRMFPDLIVTSVNETLLIETYFNAQTGYVGFYYSLGILGCYLSYFGILLVCIVVEFFSARKLDNSPIPCIMITIFVLLSFFYNQFYYAYSSMFLIWMVMALLAERKNKYNENKYFVYNDCL